MLNNIKIGPKLIGSFLIVALIIALVGLMGMRGLKTTMDGADTILDVAVPQADAVMEMKYEQKKAQDLIGEVMLTTSLQDLNSIESEFKKTIEQAEYYRNSLLNGDKSEKAITKATDNKEVISLLSDISREQQKFFDTAVEIIKNKKKVLEAAGGNLFISEEDRKLRDLMEVLDGTASNIDGFAVKAELLVGEEMHALMKNADDAFNVTNNFIILLTIIGFVTSFILGIVISRNISAPLNKVVGMLIEMSKGHLGQRLKMDRRDEIGIMAKAMDEFSEDLQKTVIGNMKDIASGNVNIEVAIKDRDDEIGPALKLMVETLQSVVREMNQLTKSALEGKLDVRGNAEGYKGAYQEIVAGVNRTLDAVVGPITEAAQVLDKVAAKDMTARMKGDYKGELAKIKEAMNTATDNLDKALQQVAIGAEQVASASVQVSTGGQALSQGTSEQASSLEEVSSSLQEMSSMTKQNTANAKEAKGVADHTRESSERGVESMSRLSSAINKIKSSSDSTAKIVKTIDEIAFQTNLLALNAAVEAARAGDAGKGFAVVAEEVRNLAMRSAEAAKTTANLIEDAVKNSENGVAINAEVLKNFQEINERTNKVSQVVAEIAAASEQQDQGISQVNKAVEQLNQVTQQNAANAEESASAAEEMSSQSEEMRSMVQGFKLTSSSEFSQALRASSQSGHYLHNMVQGKKGGKAAVGLQPDPRRVIPLDEKDHNILKTF